jgi:mannose-6-phosphate isomerase-like protein (cupin superfamily)
VAVSHPGATKQLLSAGIWPQLVVTKLANHRGFARCMIRNRRVAFEALGHWFGHVEAEPETMHGWHHHGDNITVGYVLKGEITLEFGPGGREQVEVNEGE